LEVILQAAWDSNWETESADRHDKLSLSEEARHCMDGARNVADASYKPEWEAKVKEGFKKGNKFGHSITKPMPATCVAEVPDGEGGTTTAVDKVIQHYAKAWGS
jgi:hypothetical protein